MSSRLVIVLAASLSSVCFLLASLRFFLPLLFYSDIVAPGTRTELCAGKKIKYKGRHALC